jgi:hypothetical protein
MMCCRRNKPVETIGGDEECGADLPDHPWIGIGRLRA